MVEKREKKSFAWPFFIALAGPFCPLLVPAANETLSQTAFIPFYIYFFLYDDIRSRRPRKKTSILSYQLGYRGDLLIQSAHAFWQSFSFSLSLSFQSSLWELNGLRLSLLIFFFSSKQGGLSSCLFKRTNMYVSPLLR